MKRKKIDDSVINIEKPNTDNVNDKIILPEKQKHNNNPSVSAYENHRYVVIGPSNVR